MTTNPTRLTMTRFLVKRTTKRARSTPKILHIIIDFDDLTTYPQNLQTHESVLRAVSNDGMMLKHVRPDLLRPDIKLAAVKSNPMALKYIPGMHQTTIVCDTAAGLNISACQYVYQTWFRDFLINKYTQPENECLSDEATDGSSHDEPSKCMNDAPSKNTRRICFRRHGLKRRVHFATPLAM